jgi:hypothetical protein
MIDRVKKIVETILNKEKVGVITPEQFDNSADKAQRMIHAGYFDSEQHKTNNRELRGMAMDSVRSLEEKKAKFFVNDSLTVTSGIATLPSDLFHLEKEGILYSDDTPVDILPKYRFRREKANSSTTFPVGFLYDNKVEVSPDTITSVDVDYYRKPLEPKWTYTVQGGTPFFNESASDFQDFELHPSEEPELIMLILSDFGVIKRESDITQLINSLKQYEDQRRLL